MNDLRTSGENELRNGLAPLFFLPRRVRITHESMAAVTRRRMTLLESTCCRLRRCTHSSNACACRDARSTDGVSMNQMDFTNRRAVVTGGAAGIGLAVATRLAASGAHVALWDRDERALARARDAVGGDTVTHA